MTTARAIRTPEAATVVVDPVVGQGDATTIQEAIALLPAGGGTVFVQPGTYAISDPIVLPKDKNVHLIAAGEAISAAWGTSDSYAVKIDLGANLMSALKTEDGNAKFQLHVIEGINFVGTNIAGQSLLKNKETTYSNCVRFINCAASGIESLFSNHSGSVYQQFTVELENCVMHSSTLATAVIFNANTNNSVFRLTNSVVRDDGTDVRGRYPNGVQLVAFQPVGLSIELYHSSIAFEENTSIVGLHVVAGDSTNWWYYYGLPNVSFVSYNPGTPFTLTTYFLQMLGGLLDGSEAAEYNILEVAYNDYPALLELIGAFSNYVKLSVKTRWRVAGSFIGCGLEEILFVGASNHRVVGCEFFSNVGQSITIDGTSSQIHVVGNYFKFSGIVLQGNDSIIADNISPNGLSLTIVESGSADRNVIHSNQNFVLTAIGPDTRVEGVRLASKTGVATTDPYVEIFTHKNPKGIGHSAGLITNTHAANGLTVQETFIDAWGVTGTVVTAVPALGSYALIPDNNIPVANSYPLTSYKVEVKSTTPGNAATYSLRHSTSGAL